MPSYATPEENDVEENINDDSGQLSRGASTKGVLNKSKSKKGGWKEASNAEDERLKPDNNSEKKEYDSDSDIPYIPQLEDHGEHGKSSNVAMAPQVAINRVSTYKELDLELKEHAPLAAIGGNIDLKLLTMKLLPEASVREPAGAWKWEQLFAEIKSELMNETEQKKSSIEPKQASN